MQALKENNRIQRSDVVLDKSITSALVQHIFSGNNLFGKGTHLDLELENGERIQLSKNTLNSWITRNNVIPETGQTLRNVLEDAKAKYRAKKREERQEKMLLQAEGEMHRTLNLRTNLPVVGMFGIVKDENGNIVRRENSNLLKIKMDTAKFLAERLDPNRYAQQTNVKGSHLVFSLADLRSASMGEPVKVEI